MKNAPSYSDEEVGWVNLAGVGSRLIKVLPNLHARNYDYDNLRQLVEASGVQSRRSTLWAKSLQMSFSALLRNESRPLLIPRTLGKYLAQSNNDRSSRFNSRIQL